MNKHYWKIKHMSKQTILERLIEACKINKIDFVENAVKQVDLFVHKIYYDCLLASLTNNNFDIATIIVNLVPNRGSLKFCDYCNWNANPKNISRYTHCVCSTNKRQNDNEKIFKLICGTASDSVNLGAYNFFIDKMSLRKITPTTEYINIFFSSKMINMPQAGNLFMDLFTELTKQITIKKQDFIIIYEYFLINYKDANFYTIYLLEKYAENQYQNTISLNELDVLRPICENGNYEGFMNILEKEKFNIFEKYDIKNLFIYACRGGNINIIKYLLNCEPVPNILDGIIMLCYSYKEHTIHALKYLTSISIHNENYRQDYVENEFGERFFEKEPYISLICDDKIIMSEFFKINYYFKVALINNNIMAMKYLIKLYKMKQFYYTPVDIYNINLYEYNSVGSSSCYLVQLGYFQKNKTYKTKNILL